MQRLIQYVYFEVKQM